MRFILAVLLVFLMCSIAQAQQMGNSYYNWLICSGRTVDAQAYLSKVQAYNFRIVHDPVFRAQEAQKIREAQILNQRLMMHHARRHVGFAPVITWLPSGTHLGASVVVSPDRRYVRFGGTVMFSSVGPIRTFTYHRY
jgi:hypothetical protein